MLRPDEVDLAIRSDDGAVSWRLDSRRCDSSEELREALRDHRGPLLIHTGPLITYADVARTVDIVTAAGVTDITFASNRRND